MKNILLAMSASALSLWAVAAYAQETAADEDLTKKTEQVVTDTREKVEEIAKTIDKNDKAHEFSAGLLQPIYKLAEYLSFPMFHWVAFTVMVAGVVSFALQLVLAKLAALTKAGFSPTEILSDALGLVISLTGLVLTTQAATENSSFTASPASVLSAATVGTIAGLIFYWWGQAQELQAIEGRRKRASGEASN